MNGKITIDEAIRQIDDYCNCRGDNEISVDACEMAIEALNTIKSIKEIQEAQDRLYKKIFEGGSFLPLPDCLLEKGEQDDTPDGCNNTSNSPDRNNN